MDINDKEIDVEKIMEQVKEKIKNKKESGLADDNEIKIKMNFETRLSPNQQQDLENYLTFLNQKWDPKGMEPITSHRRVSGPVIIFFKKILRKILKPFTNTILMRQTEFNSRLVKLLNVLTVQLNNVNNGNNELSKKHDELHNRHDELNNRHDEMIHKYNRLEADFTTLFKKVDNWHDELVNDFGSLFRKVDNWHDELVTDFESLFRKVDNWHDELVIYFEELNQKHIELFQNSMDVRQENIIQKHRLDRILSKIRAKYDLTRNGDTAALIQEKENLMDHNYFLFENKYRGSQKEIKERQKVYLPVFKHSDNLLDIGCGRGEFLELLKNEGIKTIGIDLSEDMIYVCKEKGLNVKQVDAISYLNSIKDNSLGGIIASHLIEHFNTELLFEFVKLCYCKLKEGAHIVLETPNPQSVTVSAINFYLDLSHVKHVHPDSIKFLLESNGFLDLRIKHLSPFPDEMKLQLIKKYNGTETDSNKLPVGVLNKNIKKLNDLLYGYQDYAVIGKK